MQKEIVKNNNIKWILYDKTLLSDLKTFEYFFKNEHGIDNSNYLKLLLSI